MLRPEYFNDKADRMIELYQQLEDYIFKDIASRILKSQSITPTADRLIWKLEQMGESRAEITNKLTKLTGLSRRELRELLQDAVITSWSEDLSVFNQLHIPVVNPLDNPNVMSVMNAEYKKCQGELENLTKTTLNQSQNDMVRMLNEAEMRVASGLQSYSSAVCDILDDYANRGMIIDYPTGAKRSLEAAVRCCVVTSMNQTCAQITNQYIMESGVQYVLVSAHPGARVQQPGQPYIAGHENWQGKIYKIRGSEPDCPNLLEMTGYDIDENGSGKVVNLLGLYGYNCRHSHAPWDKSLKNPYIDKNGNSTIDTEKSRKLYENQQRQRAMERAIRKTKRELLMKQKEIDSIAEVDVKKIIQEDYDRLAYKLRQQNAAYNEFCERNDLQKQSERLKVAGFKRAQASKANGRATSYRNSVKTPMEKAKNVGYTKRTKEEFVRTAQQIEKEITQYSDRPSKWSGNVIVNNSLIKNKAIGRKEWSCDISLVDTADNGVVWHEMLHSCSASHYKPEVYSSNEYIEEATVEWLKQQICKEKNLINACAYEDKTIVLQTLNNSFSFGTDAEFAKEIFNVPLPKRYQWLENRVDECLRQAGASFEDYNEVMGFVERLKGGRHG